jgi:hypothetical protein
MKSAWTGTVDRISYVATKQGTETPTPILRHPAAEIRRLVRIGAIGGRRTDESRPQNVSELVRTSSRADDAPTPSSTQTPKASRTVNEATNREVAR